MSTLTDPHHDPRPWQDCTREDIRQGDLVEALIRGLTTRIGVAHRQDENGDWYKKDGCPLTCGRRWPLRRVPALTTEKETPMPENPTPAEPMARTLLGVPEGHGAPHHDADQIKAEDIVLQLDEDGTLRGGRAHYQNEDGDWFTEDGVSITWAARRAPRPDALTVWPAPTPPDEEVEMPTEHPAHLTDVEVTDGGTFAHMALDEDGDWCGVDLSGRFRYGTPRWIAAFTLPDGTRVRRDGDHANGEPRFVKTQVGEK